MRRLVAPAALLLGGLGLAACGGGSPKATHGIKLGVSNTSPVVGSTVTYTATVSPVAPAAGTPTGSVDFEDSGTAISGCGSQALSSGVATCAVTYTATGTHSITASYSGDANFAGSTSSVLTVTVGLGQTSVSITDALALATPLAASGYASAPFVGPASSR